MRFRCHSKTFRFFCRLLAVFWGLTTLFGAVQIAACRPANAVMPRAAAGTSIQPVCHCAMCRSRLHHGMKCCCCHADATPARRAELRARCDMGKPGMVAALVWSTPALPFAGHPIDLPPRRFAFFPPASQTALSLRRDPLPRPPRLL